MRVVRLQLIALLAAVAVLFSNGLSARTQYLCHVTRALFADRRCTVEDPAPCSHQEPQARSGDCCERVVTAARAGATGTREVSSSSLGAPLLAVLPLALDLQRDAGAPITVAARPRRAPLALGPPLFVAHCAFLI